METIAFIGLSGTGKSHRCVAIANELGVDAIIDDGLLISKNKVIAGYSAKKEGTRVAAVKRALFTKPDHILSVKRAISDNGLEKIMVLGTSYKMVDRIVKALEIEPIVRVIDIKDIATREEMDEALNMRKKEGKHVIPVPVMEIRRDFSGYFLNPLKQIKKTLEKPYQSSEDKSIVRPTFSYMGEYTISDRVVESIAEYEIMKADGVERVNSVTVNTAEDGATVGVSVNLGYGTSIKECTDEIKNRIIKSVYFHTSVNVKRVNIYIKKIDV